MRLGGWWTAVFAAIALARDSAKYQRLGKDIGAKID